MSTTNKSKSPQELRSSLEEAIRSADAPVTVEHVVMAGEEAVSPRPSQPHARAPELRRVNHPAPSPPITDPSATEVAEDDPTLEQPVVEELLEYTSDEVGVLVLTRDDQFYDTVLSAVGNNYPVLYAQTRQEAMDAVQAGDYGVLITDAGHSPLEVEKLSIELKQHLPSLVTIVAGRRDDGDALMHLLSSGHVHRFLLKPVSPGQTKLLVDSASRRHLELREQPQTLGPVAKDKRTLAMNSTPKVLGIAAAVIVALVAGAAVWIVGNDETATGPETTASPVGADPAAPQRQIETEVEEGFLPVEAPAPAIVRQPSEPALPPEVLQLLSDAESAFMEGRLAEPAGSNALDYYQAVLGMDPNNSQASEGVAAIVDVLFNQAERALVEERLDDAGATINQIRDIEPTHPRLSFMDVQWSREQQRVKDAQARAEVAQQPLSAAAPERALVVQAAPPEAATPASVPLSAEPARSSPAEVEAATAREPLSNPPPEAKPAPRPPSELDALIATSRQRLGAGAWVAGEDSAKASLLAARELAPDSGQLATLWGDLQDRVLEAGEGAVSEGELETARSWLEEAQALEVSEQALTDLEGAITTAEQARAEEVRSDLLARGLERLQRDRLTSPADDSAAFYLGQLRDLDPNYPGVQSALRDLSRKLLGRANDAAQRSDWSAASALLAQAQALDVNAELVGVSAERIRRGARQAELMAEVIPATELTLARATAADYPRAAVRRNQEGWVELEFTVAGDGTTREIVVGAAEPEGIFDEAASTALSEYVFEPYEEGGEVYERRARVRVRFALD